MGSFLKTRLWVSFRPDPWSFCRVWRQAGGQSPGCSRSCQRWASLLSRTARGIRNGPHSERVLLSLKPACLALTTAHP